MRVTSVRLEVCHQHTLHCVTYCSPIITAERLPGGPGSSSDTNQQLTPWGEVNTDGKTKQRICHNYMNPGLAYYTLNLIQLGLSHLILQEFKKGHLSSLSNLIPPKTWLVAYTCLQLPKYCVVVTCMKHYSLSSHFKRAFHHSTLLKSENKWVKWQLVVQCRCEAYWVLSPADCYCKVCFYSMWWFWISGFIRGACWTSFSPLWW